MKVLLRQPAFGCCQLQHRERWWAALVAGWTCRRRGDLGSLRPQSHRSPEPSVHRDVRTRSRVWFFLAGWGLTLPLLLSLGQMHSLKQTGRFFSSLLKRMLGKKETLPALGPGDAHLRCSPKSPSNAPATPHITPASPCQGWAAFPLRWVGGCTGLFDYQPDPLIVIAFLFHIYINQL